MKAAEKKSDVVCDDVAVTDVGPMPFTTVRRIVAAVLAVAIVGAVMSLASALAIRPVRVTWFVMLLLAMCVRLAFPGPRKRHLRERVRVSHAGVTCAGELLIAFDDIARATAIAGTGERPRLLQLEHRERGRYVALAPSKPDDVDAMLDVIGAPSSSTWTTEVERRPEMDAFSRWWRLGQISLIAAGIPFAAMSSLEGWGFVILLVAVVAAVFWGHEMRFVELVIDADALRFSGLKTARVIPKDEIADVRAHGNRVELVMTDESSLMLILRDHNPAALAALMARLSELVSEDDDEDD